MQQGEHEEQNVENSKDNLLDFENMWNRINGGYSREQAKEESLNLPWKTEFQEIMAAKDTASNSWNIVEES
ncbi:hypothetical protein [Candidatus Mycoplasma haematominutum]|uniref:Uncharacterized protein n=1 Tax=Candidatus Mycoplasma haematominutum 'Birmingham 1' TaxID=1116213 RepID=G8C2R2_9MOLU|nr:hypothetical protein [Candidatus Mycoplasma haematominutum]CCE66610.1 hypothetical protein MHM_00920 [Candidatus Mycoplasma haematominutum 'Birmingham 1']